MDRTSRTGTFLLALFLLASPAWAAKPKQSLGAQFPEGEKAVYLRLVESYRKGQIKETYKYRDLMIRHYSHSVYADNAYYLAGLLDYQRGRIAEAVKNFGELQKRFPKSNKLPAALYAKSVAYSKLNLPQLSKSLLKEITKKYPGSPESQRAWIDLRMSEDKG